jgi:coatomer protein complex subunit epsilon
MEQLDSTTLDIQSLFYQGAYQACIEKVRQNSSGPLSDPTSQQRLLYGARSAIASDNPSAAIALLPSHSIDTPAAQAVRGLAKYYGEQRSGNAAACQAALTELRDVLDQAVLGDPTGEVVRVCVATALARENDPVGALEVLDVGNGTSKELECIALGVHILLSINRLDAAQKEYNAARAWADDSLLIQLIEAHIGIYEGGRAAQQAYYVYDELAQNPAHAGQASISTSLTGKAVARMVSSEYQEAASTLTEASRLVSEPDANFFVQSSPTFSP